MNLMEIIEELDQARTHVGNVLREQNQIGPDATEELRRAMTTLNGLAASPVLEIHPDYRSDAP